MEEERDTEDHGSMEEVSVAEPPPAGGAAASAAENAPVKYVPAVANRLVCAWAFELVPGGDDMYSCRRCNDLIKHTGSGYGNLMTHFKKRICFRASVVATSHPDYYINMQPIWRAYHEDKKRGRASSMFAPKIDKM